MTVDRICLADVQLRNDPKLTDYLGYLRRQGLIESEIHDERHRLTKFKFTVKIDIEHYLEVE